MKLEIITPEKIEFSGEVSSITMPGTSGRFTVLENHASLIASLTKGVIKCRNQNNEIFEFQIDSGLCEVNLNMVYICVDQIINGNDDGSIK